MHAAKERGPRHPALPCRTAQANSGGCYTSPVKRKWRLVLGVFVILMPLLLGLGRVPVGNCVMWRWAGGSGSQLKCQGWYFSPPLVSERAFLEEEHGLAVLAGKTTVLLREGSSLEVHYRACLQPGFLPARPEDVRQEAVKVIERYVQENPGNLLGSLGEEVVVPTGAGVGSRGPGWLRDLSLRPAAGGWWERFRDLSQWARAAQSSRPLLVVGWDGADWELVDRLLARQRLPNLARLLQRGTAADLTPVRPLVSPLIWTTIATGMPPEVHGIFDFLRQSVDREEPVRSTDRRVPALWNILSALGVPVGVVAWWATWPAEPVRGFVVSDRVAYQLHAAESRPNLSLLWPPAAEDLLQLRVEPRSVPIETLSRFVALSRDELMRRARRAEVFEEPVAHLAHLLASSETYHQLALAGIRRYHPRVLFLYEEGTDTIGHLFGAFTPPRQPFVSSAEFAAFSHAVDEFYQLADRHLGEILAALGEEANVILCSDHGFTWGEARPRVASQVNTPTAAYWHREPGLLITAGPDFARLQKRQRAHVYDIAPTVAAVCRFPADKAWPGKPVPWVIPGAQESEPSPVAWNEIVPKSQPAAEGAGAADQALVAKLRSLGYLAPAASSGPLERRESLGEILNRGTYLLDKGDLAAAEGFFRQATALRPELPGPWIKLAECLRLEGKAQEAVEAATKGLERATSEAHRELAWLSLSMAFLQNREHSKAAAALEEAVRNLPQSFVLWNTLGGVYLEQGKRPEAYHALTQAAALREEAETLKTLAALELELHGNRQRAEDLLRRAATLEALQAALPR